MRGHCLKYLRKTWIDIIKGNVTYHFLFLLDIYHFLFLLDNCETVFQDFGTRFCPQIDISHLKTQRRNSENQIYSIFNPASDSDLEEGVNEKQHHESEDGELFTLQR